MYCIRWYDLVYNAMLCLYAISFLRTLLSVHRKVVHSLNQSTCRGSIDTHDPVLRMLFLHTTSTVALKRVQRVKDLHKPDERTFKSC